MVKREKFALELSNGVQARSIADIKENFDLEKIVFYFLNGKLRLWLEDRYYEEEMAELDEISLTDSGMGQKLCSVFNVSYKETFLDAEASQRRKEKLNKLKKITKDEKMWIKVDLVAFNQEELAEIYDDGAETIYLCEGTFDIPVSKQSIQYINLGDAIINYKKSSKAVGNFESRASTGDYDYFFDAENRKLYVKKEESRVLLAKNVDEYCTYGDKVFIYCRNELDPTHSEVFRLTVDNPDPNFLLHIDLDRTAYRSFICNEKYLFWVTRQKRLNSDGEILRCNHNGKFLEVMSKSPAPSCLQVNCDNLYFTRSNVNGIFKIDLNTRLQVKICDAKAFIIYNNKLYFIKVPITPRSVGVATQTSTKAVLSLFSAETDGTNAEEVATFPTPAVIRKFEIKNGLLMIEEDAGRFALTYDLR